MNFRTLTLLTVGLFVGAVILGGCQYTRGNVVTATSMNSDLSTFHMLLQKAEMNKTVGKGGPYTLFAPTNEAFNRLPAGTVEDLQKPQNRSQLVSILSYHIVPGEIMTNGLTDGMVLTTEKGAKITISSRDGQWYYGDARIVNPDIKAMNGVVQVVNKVQMPPMTTP